MGKASGKKLHYLGCRVHRIVEDFVIQAGDFVSGDGSGGESIYGKSFIDENFTRRHAHAGVLSMANHGRNTNGSQFFVTLKPCPHLDGKHVVFGQVVEGMEVVRAIAKVPTDLYEKPRIPVHVFDCGEEGSRLRDKLLTDEFQQPSAVAEHLKARELKRKAKAETKEPPADDKEEEEKQTLAALELPSDKTAQRLLELRLKMNEARKLNNKAVVEEQERVEEGPLYEKRRNKDEFVRDKRRM